MVMRVGLDNLGLNCYINSIIQVLHAIEDFRNDLINNKEHNSSIIKELCELFTDLSLSFSFMAKSPENFIKSLKKSSITKDFDYTRQEDCSEFLFKLFELCNDDENSCEIIKKYFVGEIKRLPKCTNCNKTKIIIEKFNNLQLCFSSNENTIQDMFNNCFVPETLENVKCDSCKVKCNKTETKELTQTPLHLILLLKRFDFKNGQPVKKHDYVKLNENITVKNESYELHSVIIHKGEDIESGHYYTYNKDISENKWYKYDDDEKVENVKFNVIENLKSPDTPYMVLYKKKDNNNNNNNLNKKNEQLKISPIKVTNKLDIHNNTVTKKPKIISNVILNKKKIANKIDLNLNNDDKSIGKCKTWVSSSIIPIGLANFNNSCYINSIIHPLMNTDKFYNKIMNTNYEEFDPLKRIFHLLINKESSKLSFKRLILKLKTEAFDKETCAQQDTSEFLIRIFNNYSENKNCKKIIEDLFYGEYNEYRQCTNKNCDKFCSKESFFINNLNIQTNTTVRKLMSKNYKNEDQNCVKCGQNNSCTIKKINTILPPYMIFNLNYFVHDKKSNKFKLINNVTLKIDEEIKLPILKASGSVGGQIYIIYAIIIHDGNTLNSGHYYTYCKDKNTNIWYCFNDNIVTPIKFEDIKTFHLNDNKKPYLLFYKKSNISSTIPSPPPQSAQHNPSVEDIVDNLSDLFSNFSTLSKDTDKSKSSIQSSSIIMKDIDNLSEKLSKCSTSSEEIKNQLKRKNNNHIGLIDKKKFKPYKQNLKRKINNKTLCIVEKKQKINKLESTQTSIFHKNQIISDDDDDDEKNQSNNIKDNTNDLPDNTKLSNNKLKGVCNDCHRIGHASKKNKLCEFSDEKQKLKCTDCKKNGHSNKRSTWCRYNSSCKKKVIAKNSINDSKIIKRRNPSKTLKEKERHSTVQIGLKTAIGINTFNLNKMEKKDYDEKLELYNIIIGDVRRLSKLARDASILYEYCINHPNKWLLNYIANSDKEPRVNDIFNRLRANVKVIKDIDENIIRLLADYENDRPKNVKIPMLHNTDGCSRPYEEMMTQFETNLKVNLNEHGPKRVAKYFYSLKIKTKDGKEENKYTKDEIKKLLDDLFIYNEHPKEELFKGFEDLDFSLFYRKTKWWKFLPFFHKLQGILKNFILIPTFQCNLKHIRYSNTGLKQLASRLYNLKKREVAENYDNNNIKELWKKMFPHIPHFENFDCSMTTNAVYACFLYKKKQKINDDDDDDDDDDYDYYYDDKKDEYIVKPEKINNIKEKAKDCEQVVTADPGFINPLVGIITRGKDCIKNFGDKEHGKPYCLKLSTYRRKTGTFKRQKKLKKITDKVDKAVNELLLKDRYKNLNTKDPNNYIQTMQWRTECTDIMSPVYTQLKVAKLSWDKIMMTRSVIDTTVNKMGWNIGKKNKKLIKNQKKQIEKKIKLLETDTSKKNDDENNDKNKKKLTNHEQKKKNKKNKLKEESDKRQNKLTDRQKYQRDRQRKKEQAKKVIRKKEKKEKLLQKYKNILSNINDHFEKKKIQFKNEPNKEKKNKIFNGNFRFYHKRKKLNGKTLFLMGSTKMSNRIRGYVFAPLNVFAKTLKKHKNIIFFNVNEYMTTQNCANCNEKCHVSTRGDRYLYCPNCHITWNRDINGGLNIGNVAFIHLLLKNENSMKNYNNFKRSYNNKKNNKTIDKIK